MTDDTSNPDWGTRLADWYPHLSCRVSYLSQATPADIRGVRHGVVFFAAWWSGPARQALEALADALLVTDTFETLTLTVIDMDGASGFDAPPFDRLGWLGMGCGQAMWVSGGEVRHLNRFGAQTDRLREYSFDLLRHPPEEPR